MTELVGKVAVVTGGSRGLGREMVWAFARAGADVVIASRKFAVCEELAAHVVAETGRRALPIACHVGDWDALEPFVDQVYDEMGRVDVLVNNAGIAPLYPSLLEVSEALFDKTIDVNLKGPFRLTALMGERMVRSTGGSIINISSFAASRPSANDIVYAAAKAGLNTLTAGFASTLGPTVRVNCIMVGPFLTDIAEGWDLPAFEAWAKARYALQRLGQPEEIVGTVLYFATSASSFTSGAVLTVDGGVAISSPFPD